MIENIIPRKLGIDNILAGYTKVYLAHSPFVDEDVQGKVYWVDSDRRILDPNLDRLYTVLTGFSPNSSYNIQGAFYDSMVDEELLDNKLGINLSDTKVVTTASYPKFSGHLVTSEQVDVGVGTPAITFQISGDANIIRIEKQEVGKSSWEVLFFGSKTDVINMPINPGTYNFRLTGYITLPDGVTTDESTSDLLENVEVQYEFNPPSKPSNLSFKVAKLMDGMERYDLKAAWDWAKGTGSNVREFVLYFVAEDEYNKTQWNKASTINGGASQSTVITGFPFNKNYKFRVAAVAWGPDKQAITYSDSVDFIITKDTPLDSSFVNDTSIEVTYSHIKAFRTENNVKQQTFLIDAATGAVAIGLLDSEGRAPITFDPIKGNVNVDGSVISKEIYAASFVLSNLDGTDNPSIRTSNKTAYADPSQGMWAGYDETDSMFKFDLGSQTQHIRWDGNNLVISGNVKISTPGGDFDIGEGIQGNFVANIYIEAPTPPAAPTTSNYPPAGWSVAPITATNNPVWISSAVIDSKSNKVADGQSWSNPVRFSATPGTDGYASVSVYKAAATQPTTPTDKSIPPAGWLVAAPARTEGSFIWVTTALRKGADIVIEGSWSKPSKLSGDKGDQGNSAPTLYTWVRYANDASGNGMSASPAGKDYIGFAYNKLESTPSTNPSDYAWAKYIGTDGVPGASGEDGKTYYTWIKYADTDTGSGMSDNPAGKIYLGLAYNKLTATESTNPNDYSWSKIQGPKGETGIPGVAGDDGITYYTWIKYADTSTGGGMSDSPLNKEYMGLAVNQLTPIESNDPSKYTWSKTKGDQGIPGNNAPTMYLWVKYADTATGTGITDDPNGKAYIGLAYNKTSATESNNPADYQWTKVEGEKGDQGIPGAPGANAIQYYTWLKYADTSTGSGMSDSPAGKKYMGIAVNQTVQQESTDPTKYTWSKVEGDKGVPGTNGTDGKTTYTWVKYADNASGSGLTDSPTGKAYIGFAYNKLTQTESTNPSDYSWSKVLGDKGDQGIPGPKGTDGTDAIQYYTWIRYADTSTGGGISNSPTGKKYMGIAVNKTSPTESSNAADYTWSKVEGDKGVPGTNGIDGTTTYTWIKYADNASGSGISNSPTGKKYIGFAYNKTTATESNNASDYQWSKVEGDKGDQGIQGPKGTDAIQYYTWLKYADDASGNGMVNLPDGKKYIGIAVNQTSPTESTDPTKYQWSKVEGDKGVPGVNGTDGKTYYTWIKYADNASGSGITDNPTGKPYIGFAYNKSTQTESNTPSDYTWSKIEGDKGDKGDQGIPGTNAIQYYTWIKYADNSSGGGMSNSPTGKKYMGIAVNKTSPTESNNAADYSWSKVEGDKGVAGTNGTDGKTTYTWIKYADNASGGGLSNSPTGKSYIGFAYNKLTATESTVASDYQWSKVEGDKGDQGIPGPKGTDGTTYYTWIKYADTSTGGGMSDSPTNKKYLGIATNKPTATESTNPADYTWTLIKGDQGIPGSNGTDGTDGVTYYTWIKYATSATGSGISDDPTGKTYIGIAYNKLTQTESNNASDYTWSKIKGEDGQDGQDGTNGTNGSRGPGFYRQGVANLTAFDTIKAADFFSSVFGTAPVKFDVLTQYNTNNLTQSFTKQWDGTSWVTPALTVSGDMIVDGSITADKLVADSAFLNKMGVNVIYDSPAFNSGNPEANYKMKIDLQAGSIHIR